MDAGEVSNTKAGIRVYQRTFGAPGDARAGALLLHGLGEHSNRHEELMGRFARHGIYCRTFDWPGHGLSDGQRGHFDSLESITVLVQEQMAFLRRAVGPSKPLGLLGHSMGGFFALYFLTRFPELADFAWTGSPLIDPEAKASWFKRKLAVCIDRVLPRFPIPTGIQTSQCRLGPDKRSDPLMHRRLTVRLGTILIEAAREIQVRAGDMNPELRLLLTHGSEDAVCSADLSRSLFDRLPNSCKSYVLLEGALHEPFVGPGRTAFHQALDTWITETLLPSFGEAPVAKQSTI